MKFLAFSLLLPFLAAAADESEPSVDRGDLSLPCRLWMAPSYVATDGRAKYGLFAGIDYDPDDVIPSHELAFPLIDLFEPQRVDANRYNREILDYIESFSWTGHYAGAQFEGNVSTNLFVPGVGNLANHHPGYHNVDWAQHYALNRDPERSIGPSAPNLARGAITPYHNMTLKAVQAIPQGMELFADFGFGPVEDDVYQERIVKDDYALADKIIQKIVAFFEANKMDDKLQEEVLDLMLDKILAAATEDRAKAIRSLIPDRPSKLAEVVAVGGSFLYRNQDMIKSPEWLKKYGFCVDKLSPGTSTLKEAGRGAFAARDIRKGETIVPVPVIPVGNSALFDMYELEEVEEKKKISIKFNYEEPRGHQIALNYCFGHPESSMLLMPLAPMASFINHGSLESGLANAYVTWSQAEEDSVANDNYLHDFSVRRVMEQDVPNIVLSIDAIRDIKEGEEILIDYGPEWVAAWEKYVKEHEAETKGKKWPIRAEELRTVFADKPFAVNVSADSNPYPDGVATACYIMLDEMDDGVPRHAFDGTDMVKWIGPQSVEELSGQTLQYCDLMERFEDPTHRYVYNVRTLHEGRKVQLDGVPHYAITVVNMPYTSDMFVEGAFRHYIGIEDQRWPQAWRDLRGE